MVKSLSLVLMTLVLAGCSSWFENIIRVDAKPIERPVLVLPEVDQFNSRKVEWIVVTEANIDQVIADLKASNTDVALFALTDDGYKNLSLNMADIIKLIQQQKAIIAAYKQYYESDKSLETTGTQ